MAKSLTLPHSLSALLLSMSAVAITAGCQQSATVVDAVPPPSLNAPDIIHPAPVAMIPPLAPLAPLASPMPHSIKGIPADWIPVAAARPWRWIVVHHSDTPTGCAAAFDKMHREKGWDELGYHFVIGNGTQSGDGQVEVGPRWPIQKHGAHAKTPDNRFNDYGIGICLVGNFMETRPTPAQLRSLAKLIAFLQERYQIPANCIIRHKDTKPTDCPGKNLDIAVVRQMATRDLVDAGIEVPGGTALASSTTQPSDDSDLPAPVAAAVSDLMTETETH